MPYIHITSRIMLLFLIVLFFNCGESEHPDIPKFHTANESGIWEDKADGHIPAIYRVGGNKIEVRVKFSPTLNPRHYVEAIVLMKGTNTQIDVKRFEPSVSIPVAEFTLPDSDKDYWVVEKCNLHDMWRADVK